MNSRLLLGLHHAEELPPAVKSELEQLIAAIQAWANITGDFVAPGNLEVGGYGTIVGQHCLRLFTNGAVNIGAAETPITFLPASGQSTDYATYREGIEFDGTSLMSITLPGLYLLYGSGKWDLNAAGTYRGLQFRIQGEDSDGENETRAPSAAISVMSRVFAVIHVTKELLAVTSGRLGIYLEAYQDSGGTRTIGAMVSITKVG